MTLDHIFRLLREAHTLSGHTDYVVIGSLSILGLAESFTIPDAMTMSQDVDCYTKADPGRVFDLLHALGENSQYHKKSGFFLDAVSPALPTLPAGWMNRLIKVEREGITAWFLDPNDAAISKYARGEPRDHRWVRAGIKAGAVSMPIVKARLRETTFLTPEEEQNARTAIESDDNWFELVKSERDKSPTVDDAPGPDAPKG